MSTLRNATPTPAEQRLLALLTAVKDRRTAHSPQDRVQIPLPAPAPLPPRPTKR